MTPVDLESWTTWATCNRAYDVTEESLARVMLNAGVPQESAWKILGTANVAAANPALKIITQRHKKANSILDVLAKVQATDKDNLVIPKVETPSPEAFLKQHWAANRPVVFKNFTDGWAANTAWELPKLIEGYGDHVIEVQTNRAADKNFELNSIAHKTKVKLSEYVEGVIAVESSNDFYMTANNRVLEHPSCSKLLQDVGHLPAFINRPAPNGMWHLWVGPKGTVTPLHHDEACLIHIQLVGRKRWKLISPLHLPNVYNHLAVFSKLDIHNIDYAQFPLMRNVEVLDVVVNPGEAIFVPLGWWHGVTALDKTVSLHTIDFTFSNSWEFKNPTIEVV